MNKFETGQFDVVLDKGTIDSILVNCSINFIITI